MAKVVGTTEQEGSREQLQALLEAFCQGPGKRAALYRGLEAGGSPVAVHETHVMPAASLVKLFVIETLLLQLGPQQLDDDAVKRTALSQTMYPSILAIKAESDNLSWRELCAMTLITSDNSTAAFALDQVGFDAVNAHVRTLGLLQTHVRCSFRDELLGFPGRANVSTAHDMATALERIWVQRRDFPYNLMSYWLANYLRNDRIPARLPDDVEVMHKTGSLKGVVNDVGVVTAKRPYLLAVLMDEQEDRALAALAISRLSEKVYDVVERR